MKYPTLPNGLRAQPSDLPLPWQPSQRGAMIQEMMFNSVQLDNVDGDALLGFIDAINKRYVITGIAVRSVGMALGEFGLGADVFRDSEHSRRDLFEAQRVFEQEVLGLDPLPGNDGLRYYESPAGANYGTYPIQPFADLVGMESATFRSILNNPEATAYSGHVLVRADDFLVPVAHTPNNDAVVTAGMATELSDQGRALLDIALGICDDTTRRQSKWE